MGTSGGFQVCSEVPPSFHATKGRLNKNKPNTCVVEGELPPVFDGHSWSLQKAKRASSLEIKGLGTLAQINSLVPSPVSFPCLTVEKEG